MNPGLAVARLVRIQDESVTLLSLWLSGSLKLGLALLKMSCVQNFTLTRRSLSFKA